MSYTKKPAAKEDEWSEVKNADCPKEWLLQDTWEARVHKSYNDLLSFGMGGVCLVSKAQALQAVQYLEHLEHPCAVLAPCPIQGEGTRMNVLVENCKGEQHLRSRFLLKIGKSDVDVAPSLANFPMAHGVGNHAASTCVFGITIVFKQAPSRVWKHGYDFPILCA